jgi:hypothetical protein
MRQNRDDLAREAVGLHARVSWHILVASTIPFTDRFATFS